MIGAVSALAEIAERLIRGSRGQFLIAPKHPDAVFLSQRRCGPNWAQPHMLSLGLKFYGLFDFIPISLESAIE